MPPRNEPTRLCRRYRDGSGEPMVGETGLESIQREAGGISSTIDLPIALKRSGGSPSLRPSAHPKTGLHLDSKQLKSFEPK